MKPFTHQNPIRKITSLTLLVGAAFLLVQLGCSHPSNAYYDRGRVYYDKNHYTLAIIELTQAIQLKPNFKSLSIAR